MPDVSTFLQTEEEPTQDKPYLTEYKAFLNKFQQGSVSAEAVGEMIARLAQYFAETNLKLSTCEKSLSKESQRIVCDADPATGKPISVAKADLIIKATRESHVFQGHKTDLQNIEQFINALKYLQKGVLNEYAHGGLA